MTQSNQNAATPGTEKQPDTKPDANLTDAQKKEAAEKAKTGGFAMKT